MSFYNDTCPTQPTERPEDIVPTYKRRLEDHIKALENEILVAEQKLKVAEAALRAMETL